MEIISDRKRVLVSGVAPSWRDGRLPIAAFYEDLAPGKIQLRFYPSKPWKIHRYRFEGEQVIWNHGGKDFRWDRISEAELPAWWDLFREKAMIRLDRHEETPRKI